MRAHLHVAQYFFESSSAPAAPIASGNPPPAPPPLRWYSFALVASATDTR